MRVWGEEGLPFVLYNATIAYNIILLVLAACHPLCSVGISNFYNLYFLLARRCISFGRSLWETTRVMYVYNGACMCGGGCITRTETF